MTQQEPTTENAQKNTSRRWQGDRQTFGRGLLTAAEPHYVVITGTNIRSTLPGADFTPKVYDSEAIAFAAIDAENERQKYRKRIGITAKAPRSTISVAEYDRKYSAYRHAPKE